MSEAGRAEFLILALLEEREASRVGLATCIDQQSEGANFHLASLYQTLYGMEECGLVGGRWWKGGATRTAPLVPIRWHY